MDELTWQCLTTLSDAPSAQALADRLAAEGLSARVASDASVLGQAAPCRIYIDASQLRQVRRAMSQWDFTEQELTRLSLGEPSEDNGDVR